MDQLKMTEAQRKATLKDGQDAGEMLLDIEARIGELLPDRKEYHTRYPLKGHHRGEKVLPEGIDPKRAYRSRAIAEHPEIVEKVKAQARENEDIATRTAVMNAIGYKKEKQRVKGKQRGETPIEQSTYLIALDRCINILPTKPPKNWEEFALKEARAKAKIIIKRLEVFNNG